jgi:GxxExxY protein
MPLDPLIPHQEITYKIIGASMKVHGRLGPGLKEDHYQRALAIELREINLDVAEEYCLDIHDNNEWIGRLYQSPGGRNVIVETKVFLTFDQWPQVICYLAATGYK